MQGVVREKTNFFSSAEEGNAVHRSSGNNALELNNLILLRSIQQSILNKAGRNINCGTSQIDPSKNLKNFFIQSSLTFNGDPMNTRQSKTKSMSASEPDYAPGQMQARASTTFQTETDSKSGPRALLISGRAAGNFRNPNSRGVGNHADHSADFVYG
jgi:hypothetical protein